MKKFVVCLLPACLYLGFLYPLRGTLYLDGSKPLDAPNNAIFFLWSLISIALLAIAMAKGRFEKGRRIVLGTILAATVIGLVAHLSLRSSLVRYWIVRHEVMERSLGLSQSEPRPREELIAELLSETLGPRIFRDEALLRKLVFSHGSHFRSQPVAARVVFAGLKESGVSFEELWHAPQAEAFLLALLQSEADPEPWFSLDHLPEPEWSPSSEAGFHSGFLNREQARRIVVRALSRDDSNLEQLIFFAVSFSGIFSEPEREKLLAKWKDQFPEDSESLGQAYRLREFLRNQIGEREELAVAVMLVEEKYLVPIEVRDKQLDRSLQFALEGLVRSSAREIRWVTPDEADLHVQVLLGLMKAYEYEAPVYNLVSVRVPTRTRFGKVTVSSSRTETRSKVTDSRTESKLCASATTLLEWKGDDDQIEQLSLPESMVYWHDNFVARSKQLAPEAKAGIDWGEIYERLNGRIWPLGIREDYFRFPSVRGSLR